MMQSLINQITPLFKNSFGRIFLFSLLLFCNYSFSQADSCDYNFNANLRDAESNKPIPFATIKVKGTQNSTKTDVSGNFVISGLCNGYQSLIISCFGFCDSICEANHLKNEGSTIYLHKKAEELEKIVIHGHQVKEKGTETIAQTQINKITINSDHTQSLASLVSDQQGVTLISMGSNVQLPVIHGLYGSRILILNNGFKHGFQNWGVDHAPEIDIAAADNITIIKGASGVRYGAEAMGGAIIVNSNPLYFKDRFYLNTGVGYQTNGQGINANLEFGEGKDKWSYFFNCNFTKIGDRFTPNYSLTNTGKEESAAAFGTRYKFKDLDIKFYYSFVDQNLGLLRSSIAHSGNAFIYAINSDVPPIVNSFGFKINAPNQLTKHHLGKLEMNWFYSKDSKLTFRTGIQLNKRQEYDIRIESEKPVIDLDLLTADYQLEWKHPKWMELEGLLGIQYFNQNNDNNPGTGATPFIPNYNTNRGSIFLVESRIFNKNMLEAGLRVDYELNNVRGRQPNQEIFRDEYSFVNITSSLGYSRSLSQKSVFRANIGTAWRTPNMAELYSFGQHGFKNSYGLLRYYQDGDGTFKTDQVIEVKESQIRPENGYKFVGEFEFSTKKIKQVFTVYTHFIKEYIFSRPLAVIGTVRGPMPVFIFDQSDALFIGGDYSFGMNFTKNLDGIFRASYLWSKNITDSDVLINQPPISLSCGLNWNHENFWIFKDIQFSINPSYTFQQFQAPRTVSPEDLIDGIEVITPSSEIFDFKNAPDGYFLLNLGLTSNIKQFNLGVQVNNLLNTSYRDYLNEMRYFADEMGINLLFTMRYSFQKQNQ